MAMSLLTTGHGDSTAPSEQAVDALYATGHWLYCQERPTDAATVFRAMLLCKPHDERGWLALAACHELLTQTDLALDLYAVGCKIAEPAARCHLARARLLRRLERDAEADAEMARAEDIVERSGDEALRALLIADRRKP
jgi:hypothetical protein